MACWRHRRPTASALLGATVVFAADVALPLGIAAAVPYAVLILATTRARLPALTVAMAAIATFLTVAGYALSEDDGNAWHAVANRALALIATWASAGVVLEWLRAERRHLERERARSLGTLAGGMAHELNNLLTALMGNAALLRASLQEQEPGQAYVREIETAAGRAADLVNSVLAYSGHVDFVFVPTDINNVVRRTVLVEQAPPGVDVRLILEDALPPAMADESALFNVLRGLVRNAIEALTPGGGEIRITTSVRPWGETPAQRIFGGRRFIAIEVADNGPGMDEDTRRRALEPFFTTHEPGRGLGLSAIDGIVRALGGSLAIESSPGMGTRVRVLFPARPGGTISR